MSEPTAPPAETPPPEKKKRGMFLNEHGKFRPGPNLRRAILEVLEWQQVGQKPQYRIVAERNNVKEGTLKKCVSMYRRGQIEMSTAPAEVEDRKLQIATENQRSTANLLAYESYLNDTFSALLKRAKKEFKQENFLAFDQLGIPKVVAELMKTRNLRNAVEKGNFAALEKLMELHEARQESLRKGQANGVPSAASATQINVTNNTVNIHPTPATASPAKSAATLTSTQKNMRDILKSAGPAVIETTATPAEAQP